MSWHDPAPNEREAAERTWEVVRRAWEERVPLARPNVVRRRCSNQPTTSRAQPNHTGRSRTAVSSRR